MCIYIYIYIFFFFFYKNIRQSQGDTIHEYFCSSISFFSCILYFYFVIFILFNIELSTCGKEQVVYINSERIVNKFIETHLSNQD